MKYLFLISIAALLVGCGEQTPEEKLEDFKKMGDYGVEQVLKKKVEEQVKHPETIDYRNDDAGKLMHLEENGNDNRFRSVYEITAENAFGVADRLTVNIEYTVNFETEKVKIHSVDAYEGW